MSTVLDLAIAISLADHVSSGINSVIGHFKMMENASKDAQAQMEKFKTMGFIGASIAAAGAVGIHALDELAQKAGEVQLQMIQLGSVYGLKIDDSQMTDIENRAQELSQKTLFSKKDVLGINLELAHAGISQDLLSKVGEQATYLSEVEVGMGKSSSPERTAFNFAKMAEDSQITGNEEELKKFADYINRVINVTHANTESLGETFKYAMPTMKNQGWNEMDMAEVTALASRSGIEGSMAGTHIKDAFQRLNPDLYKADDITGKGERSKQLAAMMELGLINNAHVETSKKGKKSIKFDGDILHDDNGNLKHFDDLSKILHDKFDAYLAAHNGNKQELAAVLNKLGGEQGQDMLLIATHVDVLDKMKKQIDQQKTLEETIQAIRDSFNGQMHILGSNIETLGLQIGKPIMETMVPALKYAGEKLGELIAYFDKHPTVTKFIATTAAGVSTFMAVGGAITIGVAAFGALTTALSVAEIGLGIVAAISGGVVLVIGAIAVASYEIYTHWDQVKQKGEELKQKIIDLKDNALQGVHNLFEKFKQNIENNKGSLAATAAILGVAFTPAIIKLGIETSVAAAKFATELVVSVVRFGIESAATALVLTANFIGSVVKLGVEVAATALKITVDMIAALVDFAVKGWASVAAIDGQTISLAAQKVALYASETAMKVVTAAQWAFNLALDANPIGVIILALAALGTAVYELVKHWDDVTSAIKTAWDWLNKWNTTSVDEKASKMTSNEAALRHNYAEKIMNVNLGDGIYQQVDIPAFANGGVVDRPTLALVGEGGEREYIIPESKLGQFNSGRAVRPPSYATQEQESINGSRMVILGPLIGAIHQQPGEDTEALAKRVANKVERILESKGIKTTLSMPGYDLSLGRGGY